MHTLPYQACHKSTRTLMLSEAWSRYLQFVHLYECTATSEHLSALGIWWNDTSFQCVQYTMKHWILWKLYATLIIAMDDRWVKISLEQIKYKFSEPNCFLAGITCSNLLCLNCTLSYGTLLPAGPRDHCRSHTEAVTRGAFLVYCTASQIWINISY